MFRIAYAYKWQQCGLLEGSEILYGFLWAQRGTPSNHGRAGFLKFGIFDMLVI